MRNWLRFILHYRNFLSSQTNCDHTDCVKTRSTLGEARIQTQNYAADCIPDHCNEFVVNYSQEDSEGHCSSFTESQLINRTEKMC